MTPSPRGKFFWGLVLGVGLSLGVLGVLYWAGFHLMRHAPGPAAPGTAAAPGERQPLCYISPTNPEFIRLEPGKDDKGQDLAPVFPIAPGAQVVAGKKLQYWVSATDPKYVKTQPGKDPRGQDLMPVYVEMGEAGVQVKKERKIKYWVSPMDPGYVSDKPGKAPCGMDLIPVYETEGEAAADGTIAV
ncbi:MAG: hypothetical protein FJ126_13410, partial [Deltaproteobacteria bacterium]|nr:hypothetical protein [Deltaproteobacteria bacterium]